MSETHDNVVENNEHLRKAIARYWNVGIDVVRGPLTVEEVEDELIVRGWMYRGQDGSIPVPEWNRFRAKLQGGDELYFFRSDHRSWSELNGMEGYVIARGSNVIGGMFVSLN